MEAERIIELEREKAELEAKITATDSVKGEIDALKKRAEAAEAARDLYKGDAEKFAADAATADLGAITQDLKDRGFTDADSKIVLEGANPENVAFGLRLLSKIDKGGTSGRTVRTVAADSNLPEPRHKRMRVVDGKYTFDGGN